MTDMENEPFKLSKLLPEADIRKGRFITTASDMGDTRKLLKYDLRTLVVWGAFSSMLTHGTIFRMDMMILRNLTAHLVLMALITVVTLCSLWGDTDKAKNLDLKTLEELSDQINSFVPFCVAMYLNLTLARWWQLRVTAVGNLLDAFANVAMVVSTELHASKYKHIRKQVAKYGLASIELVVLAARDVNSMTTLLEGGLLDDEEVRVLEEIPPWHRPVVMWSWILRISLTGLDKNKCPAPRTTVVQKQCIAARDGLATINTYAETQLPFAYVHLVTLFVNVQNILMSTDAGLTLAMGVAQRNTLMCLTKVACLIAVVLVYQGLMGISYMILDPLGDDILDFPIKSYMAYAAGCCDAVYTAQNACPALSGQDTVLPPMPPPPAPVPAPQPGPLKKPVVGVVGNEDLLQGIENLSEMVVRLQARLSHGGTPTIPDRA